MVCRVEMAIRSVETGLVKIKPEFENIRITKSEPIGFVRVRIFTDSNKRSLTFDSSQKADSSQRAPEFNVFEIVEIELDIRDNNGSTF